MRGRDKMCKATKATEKKQTNLKKLLIKKAV